MYDLCDVLHASRGSADVINHVLCDYGEGSMGNGIRKLAGEILTVASRKGYDNGFGDGYGIGYSNGILKGSAITACAFGAVSVSAWGISKVIGICRRKKAIKELPEKECEVV